MKTNEPVKFEITENLRIVATYGDGSRLAWTDAKTDRGSKSRLTFLAKRYGFTKSADGKSAQ